MDAELEARLRVTADKQEIYDVLMRYCRGVDRRDADMIASCYHPDGLDEHEAGVVRSGREFGDLTASGPQHAWQKMSTHFIGNHFVEVEGDVAYSEAYCVGFLQLEPVTPGLVEVGGVEYEPPELAKEYYRTAGFRYVDRFERRNGEWKIAHRIVVGDWHRVDPVPDPEPANTFGRTGVRSSKDAVFTFRSDARGSAGRRPDRSSDANKKAVTAATARLQAHADTKRKKSSVGKSRSRARA